MADPQGDGAPPRNRGAQYGDFLPEAQAISEARHSPLASILILVITGFFIVLLLWAALAEVGQSVIAQGQVRPGDRVKVINHPEGGTVAEILVRDGDFVQAGQSLIRLDRQLIEQEGQRLRGDLEVLEAQLARLEAEAAGARDVSFPGSVVTARPDLVANQSRLFEARRESLQARRDSADRDIEQRQNDINASAIRIRTLRDSAAVLAEQVRSLQTLTDKGHFPFLRFQSIQRQLAETEGQLHETEQALQSGQAALRAARSKRQEIDDQARSETLSSLSETRGARDRTAAALSQTETRLDRTDIRSPSDGYVQNLAVNNIGQAVRPNDPLMSVVPPPEGGLVIEARIANRDISGVSIGQKATIKVRTYDFVKFGALEGEVSRIARDANVDPQTGAVFYTIELRTERTWLGDDPSRNPVLPGMQVDAELHTGSRSVLSYLTDRVIGTADQAFRER